MPKITREERRAYNREYYRKNRKQLIELAKERYACLSDEQKKKRNATSRERYRRNRDKIRKQHRDYYAGTYSSVWKGKYHGNKKYFLKRNRKWHKMNKERWREVLLAKFGALKCQRCGYDECEDALDFHHIDPSRKDSTISRHMYRRKPTSERIEELDKCTILCSNCHRLIHSQRR